VQLPNKWISQTIVLLPKVENDFDIYNTKDGWNHKSIFFFNILGDKQLFYLKLKMILTYIV